MNASLAGRAVVAGFVLLTGCYRYVPVAPAELQPGGELQVDLGDRGTAELARWIGPRGASITGRVTAVSDSGVTLAVSDVTRINGSTEPWRGEPVLVPRDYAERWRTKHFDRKRTWLVGAGTVAVLMAIDLALGADGFIPGLGGGDRTGSGK
jgi:hypothetical protein